MYTVVVLGLLLWHGGLDYAAGRPRSRAASFRIATFVFMLALLWHAWVGVRNISWTT